jgi:hypothetical protein
MFAAYGVDVLSPQVSPRRVAVLLERLPPFALSGGRAWSTEAELLALVIDHLANLSWITMRAHGARNAPRPRPLPRPRRRHPEPGGPSGASPERRGAGSGGWADAAAQLALMPGVTVEHG